MTQIEKHWLAALSWERVLALHQEQCTAKELDTAQDSDNYDRAQDLWEDGRPRSMSLQEALDLCRQCLQLKPFVFQSANTFAAVARELIEEGLGQLQPVEAQIIRSTVSHYVAGKVPKSELRQVLEHFDRAWRAGASSPKPANGEPVAVALPPKVGMSQSTA